MPVDQDHTITITTTSPEETKAFGQVLAGLIEQGDVLSLAGDLGAGKTCLVQGIAQGLNITEPLTSPSFLLRKDYSGTDANGNRIDFAHLDIYRLDTLHDLDVLGLDDTPDTVAVIEWGDAAHEALPNDRLDIHIALPPLEEGDDEQRTITLIPQGNHWAAKLNQDWMT
ncbi:tRNA (adenosine(37)-N6)-threonylcarbamoyltransferase complex ATPase subunit type 1 TsaE [Stomatohabitans albus]|uniref:tRNA (adenosine(37)-N6)-threonylcarbamoyltransferase complex ATPase subunit type 1 TsaE n=1 Tax=Stomatohabitans albus TaxID=3110766 RepID=UPI00300C1970